MTSGKPIDDRTRQRILTLRRRVTADGKPLTYAMIAKMLGIRRETVLKVVQDSMTWRT